MLNREPIANLVMRGLRRNWSALEDACDRIETLVPGESATRPAAVFLESELKKVTRVQDETTLEFEMARIRGGAIEHGPTQAYILKNAKVLNGYIYAQGSRVVVCHTREWPFSMKPKRRLERGLLASSYVGNRYFGHWICDDNTRALLANAQTGPALFSGSPPSRHKTSYRDLMRVPHQQAIGVMVEELAVVPDNSQTSNKQQRLRDIASRIRKLEGLRSGHGVYFHRGTTGVRRLLNNEAEIEEMLRKRGFEILRVMEMSVPDIIARSKDASVIIGVEGSQLMHGLFTMKPGGTMICIQPPDRFNNVYKDLTDSLGMRYSFVMGEGVTENFRMDPKALQETLELIDVGV